MATYDYKQGKKRVFEILDNPNNVIEQNRLPNDDNFNYEKGYYSWVTAIFVDIRQSTKLFTENKRTTVAKIVRAFTSEIIEILKDDANLRDIGIRGDCVYAIYTTPKFEDDYEIYNKAIYVNTYLLMLNKILTKKNMPKIKAGIGISTDKELVIKAGRKDAGVNDFVWIGNAVTHASKFSNMANKGKYKNIVASGCFMKDIIKQERKQYPNFCEDWFQRYEDKKLGLLYTFDIVITSFDNWITNNI